MGLDAGKLNRRISIQRIADQQDHVGQVLDKWDEVFSVWAEYIPSGGAESSQAGAQTTNQQATFRTRYIPGVLPSMRIVMYGREWNIHNVQEIGLREGLEILANSINAPSRK